MILKFSLLGKRKIEIIFQFRKSKIENYKISALEFWFSFSWKIKIEDYFDFFCFNFVWSVPRSQNCKSWQNNSYVTKVQETVPRPIKCEMTNRFLILLIMAQLHPLGFWNHKQDGGGLRSRSGQCSSSCMVSSGNFTLTVVLLLRAKACLYHDRNVFKGMSWISCPARRVSNKFFFSGCGISLIWGSGFGILKGKSGRDSGLKVCAGGGMPKVTLGITGLPEN